MKREYKLTIAILIFCLIIIIVFSYKSVMDKIDFEKRNYMLFNNFELWEQKNGKWKYLSDIKENKILNDRSFSIFIDKDNVVNSKISTKNNDIYYYDNNNSKRLDLFKFAYSSNNNNVKIVDPNILKLTDSEINDLVKRYFNISINLESIKVNQKVVYDFNSDGVKDELIILSNLFSSDLIKDNFFKLVLYKTDNEYRVIQKEIYNLKNQFDSYLITVNSIIKFENNKNHDIILSGFIPMGGMMGCPILFEIKEDVFEQTMSCQEVLK